MADVVVTGAVGAQPLTTLAMWKEASRLLRKGDDTQVDALYPRVLKTIEWYYNQFTNEDREKFVSQRGWKEIMEQLATGKGIDMLGKIIQRLVKRLLSKPSTVARGLNVLVQLAGISGHLSMNLLELSSNGRGPTGDKDLDSQRAGHCAPPPPYRSTRAHQRVLR